MADLREEVIRILSEDKAYPDCENCKTPIGHCNRCVLECHADHLIANGVTLAGEIYAGDKVTPTVELPCSIGDQVWAIRDFQGHKHPQCGVVSEMFFMLGMKLCIVVKYVARGEWGKTVFATREEAEAAIGGRR